MNRWAKVNKHNSAKVLKRSIIVPKSWCKWIEMNRLVNNKHRHISGVYSNFFKSLLSKSWKSAQLWNPNRVVMPIDLLSSPIALRMNSLLLDVEFAPRLLLMVKWFKNSYSCNWISRRKWKLIFLISILKIDGRILNNNWTVAVKLGIQFYNWTIYNNFYKGIENDHRLITQKAQNVYYLYRQFPVELNEQTKKRSRFELYWK